MSAPQLPSPEMLSSILSAAGAPSAPPAVQPLASVEAVPATAPAVPSAPAVAGPSNPALNGNPAVPQGVPQAVDEERKMDMIRGMDPAKLQGIRKRISDLSNQGLTRETSSELFKLSMIMDLYNKAKATHDAKIAAEATASPSIPAAVPIPAPAQAGPSSAPAPSNPPAPSGSSAQAAMSPAQIAQVRAQTQAFHHVEHNQPIPSYLLAAAQGRPPPGVAGAPNDNPLGTGLAATITEKTVDAAVLQSLEQPGKKADKMEVDGEGSDGEKIVTPPSGPIYAMEFDEKSIIYPYNAYTHPSTFADRKFDDEISNPINKLQRMMVPSVMPKGLDPYLLMEERKRYVETRMGWRMKELEEMGAAEGVEEGGKDVPGITDDKAETSMGIQARIELLSLRLLGKQRLLREDVVRAMHHATAVPADRSQFRRFRTHALRDARATESAERRQRSEREQRGKQRHLAYIGSICDHGRAIVDAGTSTPRGSTGDKMRRLGRAMLKMHSDTEKEEQRRLEKLAKDRLKALKADDEDAYLALLGEAKDSRIGHLLRQTDSYLETLANAVREQQNDDVHRDQMTMDHFEVEDGPASEAMFGARRQDGEEEGVERKEGKVDYYAVAHKLQEKVTGQAQMLTGGTLKDYQVKGLQWMISLYNNRLNGILADEMGLGKTIQTISLLCYLIEKKRQPGPFIVIVPLSTLTNWQMEFERWAPTISLVILKGSPIARKEAYPRLRAMDFQVCLTTYEYVIKERPLLSKIKWIHMIIDEGHRMKNVKSKLSQTLNEYYSTRYRIILTGTPLQNNLPELWALLNFVLPKIFNSVKSFDEWFSAPFANTSGEKLDLNEEEQLLVVKRLHKVLRPFLLRRLKKDVESELPDKVERVIYTKMSGLQWVLYENVKKYKMLPNDTSGGRKRKNNLQNALMQLRKICNHPFVFPEVDDDFSTGTAVDEQIVRVSGKFELLDRILPKLFATGHKVLIFFQMTEIMTIIADFFDYRGWKYCRLDGSTKADDRQTLLSTFNDPNSPYQVFILSTRAGGLGLNLQSADTVIIYDTDWNPHADLQAQDRAHRIGQKKEVRVLRLISSKTVEELVLERAQKKLELDGKVIQAGKFDEVTTGPEYEAMLAKVFESNPDEDTEETNELDDDELNELLARGDHELEIFGNMDKERKAAKLADWKASGNAGPAPPPLMEHMELNEQYRRDLGAELAAAAVVNPDDEGRGRRTKTEVKYSDGLTDEQWANAVDASDDDVDEAVQRKRSRIQARRERLAMGAAAEEAEADGKPFAASGIKMKGLLGANAGAGTDVEGPETPTGSRAGKGKKRARPSESATPSVQGDDASGQKKRKTGSLSNQEEIALMRRLYDQTNAQKSEVGEDLNQYFIKPVDKKLYPDYYQLIAQPICMNQIKRKLGTPSYSLQNFRNDMHVLFNNARQYNTEGSWVFDAADSMQAFFDKMWDEEYPRLSSSGGGGGGGIGGGSGPSHRGLQEDGGVSGSSTPIHQQGTPAGTKIKLNLGASKRREPIASAPTPVAKSEESDSDMDDDY